ncbi:hypothetical protein QF034_008172 [Streptomyces africanus]|uniref:Uncharacterized protein n=1 Tax=Streptomyces africanus TaxID=231024 RepID=A0ABU0R2V3_9ACTN|nr:hypothetical protein [Streptomyces africanus]MDQ0753941.1 hypothetical protein [Streptomyces africanus]
MAPAPSPPKLHPLHNALVGTERAGTAMRWLSKGIVSTVLSDLGSGRRPLTHEALDELPERNVVEHIRSVLVATGALPKRDEQMVRLERHVKDLVTSHATAEGRKILHRYATWHLLRRLHRRSRGKDITHSQLTVARQHLRAAVYLLNWLEGQNLITKRRSVWVVASRPFTWRGEAGGRVHRPVAASRQPSRSRPEPGLSTPTRTRVSACS